MDKYLRFKDIKNLLQISRSTIDRWEKEGMFPKRIRLGLNSIGWKEKEIKKWMESPVKWKMNNKTK